MPFRLGGQNDTFSWPRPGVNAGVRTSGRKWDRCVTLPARSASNGRTASWAHRTTKRAVTSHPRSGAGLKLAHWLETASPPPRAVQPIRIATNLVGAGGAAYFSYSYLIYFVHSRQPLGAVFVAQQIIVVIAYLVRRPAAYVTRRVDDWLLAFGGTFAGVLARTSGLHAAGWVQAGLALQLIGAATAIASLAVLGRSFGFAAANRGLVTRGPYAIVRHPLYSSYLLSGAGFLLQSVSLRNALFLSLGSLCNVGRALAEERLLMGNGDYAAYRRRVRRRMIPGVW
jgi:protein-S-isoprenylcysteine O-methyltransferase Ste14